MTMTNPPSYSSTWLRYCRDGALTSALLLIGRALPALQVKQEDLTGKIAIVTGANSGIGLSIATSLTRANATVYLACRNIQKGQEAASQIIDSLADGSGSSKRVHVVQLDTSDLKSVHAFADAWGEGGQASDSSARSIDILFHNAGIAGAPPGQEVTAGHLGTMYATNHAGPFLLTSLLEQYLTPDARVLFTSSAAQYSGDLLNMFTFPRYVPEPGSQVRTYSSVYGDTKAMQVIFARLLQQRFAEQSKADGNTRVAHSFSPGYTVTPLINKLEELPTFDPVWWYLKVTRSFATPVEEGAATGYWLASTHDTAVTKPANGGRYWERLTPYTSNADLTEAKYGQGFLRRLWDLWCVDTEAHWS